MFYCSPIALILLAPSLSSDSSVNKTLACVFCTFSKWRLQLSWWVTISGFANESFSVWDQLSVDWFAKLIASALADEEPRIRKCHQKQLLQQSNFHLQDV